MGLAAKYRVLEFFRPLQRSMELFINVNSMNMKKRTSEIQFMRISANLQTVGAPADILLVDTYSKTCLPIDLSSAEHISTSLFLFSL